MIKVYSTPTCPWCKKAKKYLNSINVDFTDVNVESDVEGRNEMMKLSKQSAVPVINIDGQIILGFDKDKIDEALKLNK